MTRRHWLVTVLSLGFASAVGAQPPPPPLARSGLRFDLAGCYALYFERGRADSSLYNAAPSVRLDTTLWHVSAFGFARETTLRTMLPLTITHERRPVRRHLPQWSVDSLTDSVRLSFVNGFSGAVFVLNAPAGRTDTLRGRVFESWDYGPPFETARGAAHAIREACVPNNRP